MARRKNNGSILEDLFEIAAALPWWVGVVLAAISYVFLHRYAISEVPKALAGQLGQMMVAQLIKTFSYYLQYLLPVIFLAGAGASYVGRKKRERLIVDFKAGRAANDVTWQEFELLVGEAFRLKGYAVADTGGGGADGGVDLMLKKGSEIFLVQCKQWRALKVSVSTVRELYGAMAARGATGGFVVTSGRFTKDAMEFAEGRNIALIDGTALGKMIEQARIARAAAPARREAIIPVSSRAETLRAEAAPACPRCGGQMVKRVAKQGTNAGKEFWGCKRFPECRGVKGLSETAA
ncbi:MAG: restriction endonuclease [Rhodospirillaceae bacterium]